MGLVEWLARGPGPELCPDVWTQSEKGPRQLAHLGNSRSKLSLCGLCGDFESCVLGRDPWRRLTPERLDG